MTMPGFNATAALAPSHALYHGGASFVIDGAGGVEPQFLGVVGEFFEHAYEGVKQAVEGTIGGLEEAARAVGSEVSKILAGLSGVQPGQCTAWAAQVLSCNNGQPAFNEVQLSLSCIQKFGPALGPAVCPTLVAAMNPLLKQYCSTPGAGSTGLLGSICNGR